MKSKLWYLTSVSLKRKMKTKWFLLANIIICLGIMAVFNIESIIKFFGGDFDEETLVYVMDSSNNSDTFKEQLEFISKSYYGEDSNNYKIVNYDGEDIYKSVKEDNAIGLIMSDSSVNVLDVTMVSEGLIDNIDYQLITTALNNTKTKKALETTKISEDDLNRIIGPAYVKREILDENKKTDEENMGMIMSTVFPILILPFFMLTIFLVQMIGAEVNDEKTTKSMEIIISNVSAKTHFASKILAGNIFVIVQGLLLMLYALLGFVVKNLIASKSIFSGLDTLFGESTSSIFTSSFVSNLWYIIPLTLILMVITFIAYAVIAGVLSSVTATPEDFQQIQSPIMVVLLIAYYLSIMASTFKGALFIRILSYVPLISAILSPSLLVIGDIGIIDVVISILIAIIFDYLLIHFGLKIYKDGILNYSSNGLWKKMGKSLIGSKK